MLKKPNIFREITLSDAPMLRRGKKRRKKISFGLGVSCFPLRMVDKRKHTGSDWMMNMTSNYEEQATWEPRSKLLSIADWSMDLAPRSEKERKLFSPAQANRTLVLVRRIVGDVTSKYQHLMDLEELIEVAEEAFRLHLYHCYNEII